MCVTIDNGGAALEQHCPDVRHRPHSQPRAYAAQQTQTICITFVQRQPNVFDAGPTLYKCYTNVLCLLGSGSQL